MTLARGACYWPDCGVPTIRMINARPRLNLEIAHIRAFDEGGKRYDPNLTVQDRNNFDNLILLCNPHHEEIDGSDSDQYPVQVLEEWKYAREVDGLDALAGLGDLTRPELAAMITAAQGELLDRFGPALDEFAKTAPQLAALLRAVIDELADPRIHGFGISEDAITQLYSSARTFANLEDSANTLASAADTLRTLQDNATTLADAADSLENLGDWSRVLSRAADKALRAADMLSHLQ